MDLHSDELKHVAALLQSDEKLREQVLRDPAAIDQLPISEAEKNALREALDHPNGDTTNSYWY